VDRDPQNEEALRILRVAMGNRTVSIDASGADADIYARKIVDSNGRPIAGDSNDAGKLLGRTPLKGVELEAGMYILSFQRTGAPTQQAVMLVARDATDEDLAFKITLNAMDENMVKIPAGDVRLAEGDSIPVKEFYIDRFEYPNKAGVVPAAVFTYEEAHAKC